jgi:hypothetical protein
MAELKGISKVWNGVSVLPAADVAPVVRCTSCKNRKTESCPMYENSEEATNDWTADDGFCSLGVKMEVAK